VCPFRDLLKEAYRISHSNAKLLSQTSRELQEGEIDCEKDFSTEQFGGRKVKRVKALEPHREQVVDSKGHFRIGERGIRYLRKPEIHRVSTCLYWVKAVLQRLSGGTKELGNLPRKGQDADHRLGLEPDKGLFLGIEGSLEAAEIEVDTHGRSLPESGEKPVDRGPVPDPQRGIEEPLHCLRNPGLAR